MARKRLIAPEFFTHPGLYELEAETRLPVRVAFAGLWTQCDRRGIFRWRPLQLKLAICPYDPIEFEDVLDALVDGGFVLGYEVGGRRYGIIPTMAKHQTFHRHEAPSSDPAPSPELLESHIAGLLATGRLQGDPPLLARSPDQAAEHRNEWIPRAMRLDVLRRDNYRCTGCGATGDTVTVARIITSEHGGKTEPDNLHARCRRCQGRDRRRNESCNEPAMDAGTPVAVTGTVTVTGAREERNEPPTLIAAHGAPSNATPNDAASTPPPRVLSHPTATATPVEPESLSQLLATFDFGDYSDAVGRIVRAAKSPDAVVQILRSHLEGKGEPQSPALVVGRACLEYEGSGEPPLKANFFGGIVRKVRSRVEINDNRARNHSEQASIDRQRDDESQRRREVDESDQLVERFRAQRPERYAELERAAENDWPNHSLTGRPMMVRGSLIAKIRAEPATP